MLGLSTTVFRLVSKKNTFLPFHEQFLAFCEVGLHFLEVGLLGSGLGAVEGLRKFKIEFVLVFVSSSFKLERLLKFLATLQPVPNQFLRYMMNCVTSGYLTLATKWRALINKPLE